MSDKIKVNNIPFAMPVHRVSKNTKKPAQTSIIVDNRPNIGYKRYLTTRDCAVMPCSVVNLFFFS